MEFLIPLVVVLAHTGRGSFYYDGKLHKFWQDRSTLATLSKIAFAMALVSSTISAFLSHTDLKFAVSAIIFLVVHEVTMGIVAGVWGNKKF